MSAGAVSAAITFLTAQVAAEISFLYGVSDKIQELIMELEWTRAFLEDAEKKQRGKSERLMRKWIDDVRDTSYSLEDELEKYILVMKKRRQQNCVFRYACIFKFLVRRHQIGTSIDRLQMKIENISKYRSRYGIENSVETNRRNELENEDLRLQRRLNDVEEESSLVGLQNDLKLLKNRLLDTKEKRRCCISVVGMGGLGKTTITRKVYKDVRMYFDCSAWVDISQEFKINDVLGKIMKDITRREREKDDRRKDEEKLKREINKLLKGKRYLVVLDDVWNHQLWQNLSSMFPDDKNGSRLLLTTRKENVARHVDPRTSPHNLRVLDKDESWKLFRRKACLVSGEDPEVLLNLGKRMTEKCGGLPLAITVLGGLMSQKPKQADSWARVLNRISSELKDSPKQCKDILAMSYYDLPFEIKPCFLYFAVFRKESDIPAKKLVHFWVAENLVEAGQDENLEDAAKKYLEVLISRSLVQVSKREYSGELQSCRIHDLLRDLAIEEARKDNFLDTRVSKATEGPVNVCRLSIQSEVPQERESFKLYTNSLRSLFLISPISMGNLEKLIPKMQLLRVLELVINFPLSVLPEEINQLIHLRYLRLRFKESYRGDSDSDRLSSICPGGCFQFSNPCVRKCFGRTPLSPTPSNLKYLQTLDFGSNIVYMSHSIWCLCQLRHLYGKHLSIVGDAGDQRIDRLKKLQTLYLQAGNWINVGLENLSNLRDLRIYGDLSKYHEVIWQALKKLLELRFLNLTIYDGTLPQLPSLSHLQYLTTMFFSGQVMLLPDEFPQGLVEFHLSYDDRFTQHDPLATLHNIKGLKYLSLILNKIQVTEINFLSGRFSKLQVLKLKSFRQTLNIEKGSLRRLKRLEIDSPNLNYIPDGLKYMERLRELKLYDVSTELFDRLKSGGKDWQKIKQVTSIHVTCDDYRLRKDSKGNPRLRNDRYHISTEMKHPSIIWQEVKIDYDLLKLLLRCILTCLIFPIFCFIFTCLVFFLCLGGLSETCIRFL